MKIKEIINNERIKMEENATSGATSSGNIATVSSPLGGWIGFNPDDHWRSIYTMRSKRTKRFRKKSL
ncbi:MAG: hypothetical protein QXF12_01155 [Candidatus Aenigmatarchaeota archaeon]